MLGGAIPMQPSTPNTVVQAVSPMTSSRNLDSGLLLIRRNIFYGWTLPPTLGLDFREWQAAGVHRGVLFCAPVDAHELTAVGVFVVEFLVTRLRSFCKALNALPCAEGGRFAPAAVPARRATAKHSGEYHILPACGGVLKAAASVRDVAALTAVGLNLTKCSLRFGPTPGPPQAESSKGGAGHSPCHRD